MLKGHSETDLGPDCACGWTWEGYGLWKDAHADHVADAVIDAIQAAADAAERGKCNTTDMRGLFK